MKTYVFKIEIEQYEDGYWEAEIPSLPGCAVGGDSREEALEALRVAAQTYLEILAKHQQPLPKDAEAEVIVIPEAEVVTVTL
jgi:predicted RNase H-like HicB family nuclease